MNPAQYWLTISMIIAAQAPLRQLHAAPVQADTSECETLVLRNHSSLLAGGLYVH
jgi:hypothetical protein